jgi:hypothetical protein
MALSLNLAAPLKQAPESQQRVRRSSSIPERPL